MYHHGKAGKASMSSSESNSIVTGLGELQCGEYTFSFVLLASVTFSYI